MSEQLYDNAPNVMSSKVYRFRSAKSQTTYCVWAENGVVLFENQNTGEFHTYPVQKARDMIAPFLRTVTAHRHDAAGASGEMAAWDKTEGEHQANLVTCTLQAIRDAVAQGDPTVGAVREVQSREARRRKAIHHKVPVRSKMPTSSKLYVPPTLGDS